MLGSGQSMKKAAHILAFQYISTLKVASSPAGKGNYGVAVLSQILES